MKTVVLNEKGRNLWDQKLRTYHVSTVSEAPEDLIPGASVFVELESGEFAGIGYFNSNSKLPLRILSFTRNCIDADFWREKIQKALDYRLTFYSPEDSFRLIFGDSDEIPGLIVDKFSTYLSVQITTAGIEEYSETILDVLKEIFDPDAIVLACDSLPRKKEGLELYRKVAFGNCPSVITADVDGVIHAIDLLSGHKTGFFLDHRLNRKTAAELSRGKSVLDMFCFTGAFGLKAARNQASNVTSVDIHEPSINLGIESARLNGLSDNIQFIKAEAFDFLSETSETWDLVFLDPPSFVRGHRRARRNLSNYRKINALGLKAVSPGGIFVTSCCSFHVSRDDYLNVLKSALVTSNRSGKIFHVGCQSPDHPFIPGVNGTDYLKCFFIKLD